MIVFVIFLNGCVTGMTEMTEAYGSAVILVIGEEKESQLDEGTRGLRL